VSGLVDIRRAGGREFRIVGAATLKVTVRRMKCEQTGREADWYKEYSSLETASPLYGNSLAIMDVG